MDKKIIISCIRNVQEDYAKIFNFILKGKMAELKDVAQNTYYYEEKVFKSVKSSIETIVKQLGATWRENKLEVCKNQESSLKLISDISNGAIMDSLDSEEEIEYIVYVVSGSSIVLSNDTAEIEDDVVNLQFFSLMNQVLNSIDIKRNIALKLFLKPNLEVQEENAREYNALYYKASHFLIFDTIKNANSHFAYRYQNKQFIFDEMSKNQKGLTKKFLPLMEVCGKEDVDFWSKKLLDIEQLMQSEMLFEGNKGKLLETIAYPGTKVVNNVVAENRYYRVLKLCKEYFCTIPTVTGRRKRKGIPTKDEMTKKLLETFENETSFYNMVQDMSMLAFYIFCSMEYFKRVDFYKDYSKMSTQYIYERIFTANDIADGILQLLENVASHSQYGRGFFNFRVHSNSDIVKGYLKSKYKSYFNEERNARPYYLEVQIVDYSNMGILDKYFDDLTIKRETINEKAISESYEKLKKDISQFTLSSLFDPTDKERKIHEEYNKFDKNNLIHHYGLQLFVSLVDSCDGCFFVRSIADGQDYAEHTFSNIDIDFSEDDYFQGTQYSILLPFEYQKRQIDTSLNANINYVELLEREFRVIKYPYSFTKERYIELYEMVENEYPEYSWQRKKEETINVMAREGEEYLNRKREKDKITILDFDAKKMDFSCIEYFSKVCIYIASQNKEILAIAVRNCTENHFLGIVRMFAVFYDKQGDSDIMSKLQIYLVGNDAGEEFIITGKNIKTAISAAEKLAFTRGINGKYINVLSSMLGRRENEMDVEDIKFIPFDLEVKYDDGYTPFQRGISSVLERNISELQFGCKIQNAHMRLGSKIHIKDFYEAELLFHNNYYTSRFAYQILKEIDKTGIDENKPLMLVGYETYSEMLLYEITSLLKRKYENKKLRNSKIDYMYYENKAGIFRVFDGEEIKFEFIDEDTQYIIIVPINSTLTTHDKLIALLKKRLLGGKEPNIIEKIAIVLIRDNGAKVKDGISEMESEFWISDSHPEGELPSITTKRLSGTEKHKVKYLISLQTEWLSPLKCQYCYPGRNTHQISYTKERPLIETNKSSVVPIQKIRINAENNKNYLAGCKNERDEIENNNRVKTIGKYLIYKHIIRNNNHYNFYFETEKFMKEEKESIGKWLENECADKIEEENRLVFDILVAPLHYSNTAFVEEVNMRVFHGASLVLHFDVEKEFRDNIKTKFSNIKILYDNLAESNRRALIRFHYVDDTIVSGNTFYRMKSVIRSIFPRQYLEREGNVKIKIFDTIFLLLNRCSNTTKYNYIEDSSKYFAYVDLFISSMRNHEDACFLCKYLSEYKKLEESSATNNLISHWNTQIAKHKKYLISKEEDYKQIIDSRENSDDKEIIKERKVLRLYCTHKATLLLRRIYDKYYEDEKNEIKEIQRTIVDGLFFDAEELSGDFESILSYIKVISRPFLVYSRTIKIAPCKESSKIKESIELYNRGVYWLKYVDVLESSIPYREK